MSSLSSIYRAFTAQQRQFVDEKTISATLRIAKWQAFLARAVKYDHKIDHKIKSLGTLVMASSISIFFVIVIAFVSEEPWVLLGLLVALGGLIYGIWKSNALKEKDLNNYLRLFFIPVLAILKEKAGEQAKLSATLDFRIPRKALTPIESKVRGRKLKLYEPKYIASRVLLKDGVNLEFAVLDDLKDYHWTKRSASGKLKTKRKYKVTHQCFIKLTFPKSTFGLSKSPPDHIAMEELAESFVVKQKVKIKAEGEEQILNPKKMFEGIQQMYDCFLAFGESAYEQGSTKSIANLKREEADFESYEEDDTVSLASGIWYGSYFDRYDYDNFDHAENAEIMLDDGSVTVFDS